MIAAAPAAADPERMRDKKNEKSSCSIRCSGRPAVRQVDDDEQ